MDRKMIIENYIQTSIECYKNLNISEIIKLYNLLIKTANSNGKIYLCGNGGSAITAMHFQTDLNNAFSIKKDIWPAVCLNNSISTITALSNDYSYEEVFLIQLQYLLKEHDVLILISGSGNSTNVIKAAEYAKQKGNSVISMVGFDGGILKQISDVVIHVRADNMQIAEDVHLFFCHLVSNLIKESFDD